MKRVPRGIATANASDNNTVGGYFRKNSAVKLMAPGEFLPLGHPKYSKCVSDGPRSTYAGTIPCLVTSESTGPNTLAKPKLPKFTRIRNKCSSLTYQLQLSSTELFKGRVLIEVTILLPVIYG